MAWLDSNRGRLLIGFQYRGERCREYLGLDDNRENRRTAALGWHKAPNRILFSNDSRIRRASPLY